MWKLALSVLPSTYHTLTVNISNFLDNILKFDIELLGLTKLDNFPS